MLRSVHDVIQIDPEAPELGRDRSKVVSPDRVALRIQFLARPCRLSIDPMALRSCGRAQPEQRQTCRSREQRPLHPAM